ncbi:MAG: DUF2225 domain-containing protein, partial [Candidatus Sumerlaeia bacterium]
MAKFTTPFIDRKIPCPSCGKTSTLPFFRSRLFIPEKIETDGHVAEYKWIEDVEQKAHPPFYFIKQCPFCGFADIEEDYVNPKEAPNTRRIVKMMPELEQKKLLVIQLLNQSAKQEKPNFYSALNQHLLCIYLQQLIEDEDLVDYYKIGRLYLRVAWLYREQKAAGLENLDKKPFYKFPSYAFLRDKLIKLWPEMPIAEEQAMRRAVPMFEKAVTTDPKLSDNNAYFGMLKLIIEIMVRLGDLNEALRMIRGIYKSGSDARAKLQAIMKNNEIEPAEKRKARGQLERVNDSLTKSGELRRELIDKIMLRDKAVVRKVIKANEAANAEQMEAAFKKAKLAPEIFTRLREKGGPLEYLNKKKGW